MKNIIASLFIFLLTSGVTIYNFYRKSYVFGWITFVFALIDLIILIFTIIKKVTK